MKNVSLEEMYCADLDPDQPDYSNMTASGSLVHSIRQDSASQVSVLRNGIFFPKNNSIEKNHSCLCVCVQYPLQFVFTI